MEVCYELPPSTPTTREFCEVPQEDEYDPLGKTVTPLPTGKTITRWHLIEAIENMHDADVELLCKMARKNGNTTMGQAICWNQLMDVVNEYWAEVKERFEGKEDDVNEVYEDGYCR